MSNTSNNIKTLVNAVNTKEIYKVKTRGNGTDKILDKSVKAPTGTDGDSAQIPTSPDDESAQSSTSTDSYLSVYAGQDVTTQHERKDIPNHRFQVKRIEEIRKGHFQKKLFDDIIRVFDKWAVDVNSTVGDIQGKHESSDGKIEEVKCAGKKLTKHVHKIDNAMNDTNKRIAEMQTQIDASLGVMKHRIESVEKENALLRKELNSLQSHYKRNILVFSNIPEASSEDTDLTLREFLVNQMNMEKQCIADMQFQFVYRKGSKLTSKGIRNIVAKFNLFKDFESVRKHRVGLKGTNFKVQEGEEFPKDAKDKKIVPKRPTFQKKGQ